MAKGQMKAKFEETRAEVQLRSLEREAEGYKARGLDDRVKAVQAEISRIKKEKRITPENTKSAQADVEHG